MSRFDRRLDRITKKKLIIIMLILTALVGWYGALYYVYKFNLEKLENKIIKSEVIPIKVKEDLVQSYHFDIKTDDKEK